MKEHCQIDIDAFELVLALITGSSYGFREGHLGLFEHRACIPREDLETNHLPPFVGVDQQTADAPVEGMEDIQAVRADFGEGRESGSECER